MLDKGYQQLNIDPEFKALIRPLNKEEYSTLEANLILDGCREPIVTWMGYIVDGHNRYEICNRLHIPYGVVTYDFKSRDEAIVWICNNQLGRRNITEETRKYLIGKQYEAEKATNARNALGSNQYQRRLQEGSHAESYVSEEGFSRESGRRTPPIGLVRNIMYRPGRCRSIPSTVRRSTSLERKFLNLCL